jgi:hypothetical protein
MTEFVATGTSGYDPDSIQHSPHTHNTFLKTFVIIVVVFRIVNIADSAPGLLQVQRLHTFIFRPTNSGILHSMVYIVRANPGLTLSKYSVFF